jgi:hypothetical protein
LATAAGGTPTGLAACGGLGGWGALAACDMAACDVAACNGDDDDLDVARDGGNLQAGFLILVIRGSSSLSGLLCRF